MRKLTIFGTIFLLVAIPVYIYFTFIMKGDTVNRAEREAFIAHGSEKFRVTVLGTPQLVYDTVSKVTSEPTKGYYFFWATVNGQRRYVQTPIQFTVYEER
jgi:hypothetical protein